jgi:pimeloyl-ACP methyl ester carboxylesterase
MSTPTAAVHPPLTRDEGGTLLVQTMGLVAATAGLLALGAYLGRDVSYGCGWAFFIAAFGVLLGMNFATQRSEGLATTQRPVAELAFSEPSEAAAWKNSPSWAVVATGDKAGGTDVIRSMAERAGAAITEVEASHVVMVSHPEVVAEVILTAVAAVDRRTAAAVPHEAGATGR